MKLKVGEYSIVNKLEIINKEPLRTPQPKQKITIRGNKAYLTSSFLTHLLSLVITLLVYIGWGLVFYGLYNGQFYIKSKANILIDITVTLLLFLALLVITIGNWFMKSDLKSKAYINKGAGEIKSSNNDKNHILQDILCIQLLNYEKKGRVSSKNRGSVPITVTIYQINLVTHNKGRFTILQQNKEYKAIQLCEKLSGFLDKPFVNHITKTTV